MQPLPRHERLPDLLAASEDKHVRKTRRIRFVGDDNPANNDAIMAKVMLSEGSGAGVSRRPLTPTIIKAVRRAIATALCPVPGHFIRLMEPNHRHSMVVTAHLSRAYEWRKENDFTCDVDYPDVDVLLGGTDGHQFRDLDAMEPDEPVVITPSPEVFKLIAAETYRRDDERLTIGQPIVMPFR